MNSLFVGGAEMYLLRASALLAAFWGVYLCLAAHPRARVVLCRIVSVALLALPLLSLVPAPTVASVPSLPVMTEPLATAFQEAPSFQPPQGNPVVRPLSVATTASVAPVISLPRPTWTVASLLFVIWLTGSCLLLARWLTGLLLARRLAASAHVPPDWACEAGSAFCAHLHLRRTIRLGVVDRACSPLLVGPGPLILLPRHLFDSDSREDILSALAHEIGHVKERDWAWSQWLHLVASLLWPVPLVWFVRRAHDSASELICDHLAATLRGGAEPYAGSLARQSLLALGRIRLATVPMLRRSGIRRRIDALLSGTALPQLSRCTTGVLGLSIIVAGGVLAGVHLAHADDKMTAGSKAPIDATASPTHNYSAAEIQEIVSKLYGYFQSISSLSYTGTEVTKLDDDYDNQQLVRKTTFASSGDRYFIQLESYHLTSTGKPISESAPAQAQQDQAMAFNGHYFQRLTYGLKSTLLIQKGPPFFPAPPSLHDLDQRDYFTLPFDFVNKTMTENPRFPVQLLPDQFKRSEYWVLKTRRFQNGTLAGKRGIIMDVLGKAGNYGGDDITISILLDPSLNYYPLAWQLSVTKQNNTRRISYVVTEMGTVQGGGQSFLYPKTATISSSFCGKPGWTRTITIDQVSLNDIGPDDSRFTFDSKKADIVKRWDDPPSPSNDWKAIVAKQGVLIARQNSQIAALHLIDDKKTAIITECFIDGGEDNPRNLIVQAINLCPTASVVFSWNSDGRYLPDPKESSPPLSTTPPDAKNPWPNWRDIPQNQAPAFYINPPRKSPVVYSSEIYAGIYWALNHGFKSIVLLNSFNSGDRPSATQAIIAAMRAAQVRLDVISPKNAPYTGLSDYALESGGGTMVGDEVKSAKSNGGTTK